MLELLDRRVLFVGGKGGVGKTTMAAALAVLAAEKGRRCLLVSMDPAHSLGDLFDTPIGDNETALTHSLHAMEIDPGATAKNYIASVASNMRRFSSPDMYDEIERHLNLAQSAPGAVEAALLERLSELLTQEPGRYDLLIFDTAPTGHTLHLLSLPEVMATWTTGLLSNRERSEKLNGVLDRLGGTLISDGDDSTARGVENSPGNDRWEQVRAILQQRQEKFRGARQVLTNSETTSFVLVLNPEKLAILESKNVLESLQRFQIPVAAVVINRVLPEMADGEFLHQRRIQERKYLAEIKHGFKGHKNYFLPLLSGDVRGMEGLREIGRFLTL